MSGKKIKERCIHVLENIVDKSRENVQNGNWFLTNSSTLFLADDFLIKRYRVAYWLRSDGTALMSDISRNTYNTFLNMLRDPDSESPTVKGAKEYFKHGLEHNLMDKNSFNEAYSFLNALEKRQDYRMLSLPKFD
jgi:hypothetical protein